MEWGEAGENYIRRSFITCTLQYYMGGHDKGEEI